MVEVQLCQWCVFSSGSTANGLGKQVTSSQRGAGESSAGQGTVRTVKVFLTNQCPLSLSFAYAVVVLSYLPILWPDNEHVLKRKEVISPLGTPDECPIVIAFHMFLCAAHRSHSSKPWRTQCIFASPLFCTARQQTDTDFLLHPLTCLGTLHWSTAPESLFSSHTQR